MNRVQQDLQTYLNFLAPSLSPDGSKPLPEPKKLELKPVHQVVLAVAQKRFADAVRDLKGLDPDSQRVIRGFLSRNLLHFWQKEWTGHGINRTFRFWSEAQKRDYLFFATEVLAALRQRYQAALGYGSVLSIVRDNDLIPHDDDLDIIVAVKADDVSIYNHELSKLHHYLEEAGFSIRGDYVAHRHVSNGRFLLDVFLGLQTGDNLSWHPGPREVLCVGEVFPTQSRSLFGIDCHIPRDPERYLEVVYGSDWRTPVPGWTHDFSPARYQDWFWPGKGES